MEYKIDIPKKYSPEAIIQMKVNFMVNYGLSGDTTFNNNPWYAAEILSKIEAFHKPLPKLNSFNRILQKCLNVNPKHKTYGK